MYSRIVVGHDLREGGEDALALGQLLASATGAELIIAGVYRALPVVVGSGSPARGLHQIARRAAGASAG